MARGIIKQIFADQWEKFEANYKVREVVSKEIKKMLKCRDLGEGYSEYRCPTCGERKYVAFTCKGRFCTSCGKKATDDWVENLCQELLDVPHRHMVFTIPEKLRIVFLRDRKLLKDLSDTAGETIISSFWERSKKQKPTSGIVCAIHTFGRDLKWNPHVHVLVTEGTLKEDKQWKVIEYFHYEMLKKRWQHILMSKLKKRLPKTRENKRLIDEMYRQQKEGFHVHAKNRMSNAKGAAKYIGRYVSRPAIAESRIESYYGQEVHFWYEQHQDGKRVDVKLPVFEFMGKLIRHIPERQFKMVRYFGLYARRRRKKTQLIMSIWKKFKKLKNKRTYWRERIIKSFGHDPLTCPKCGDEMIMNDVVFKKYGSMLDRLKRRMDQAYEKEEKRLIEEYESQFPGRSVSMYRLWEEREYTRRCS
jgi:predicted RNA-binding Zn-ribbon protein involved in translation (DUF1610 family)